MKQVIAAIAVAVLGSTTTGYTADLSHGSAIYTFAQRQTQAPRSTQAPSTLSSDVIKQVQQQLKDFGYYEGEIDGKLNRETQEAIYEFQDDNHLAITGSLDAETIDTLQKSKQ
jgi:peptidoglycan hydrolase-like protein with peptidoglycan-binding domain